MAATEQIQNHTIITPVLKKWVFIFSLLSLLAYLAINCFEILNRANTLPLGFRYTMVTSDQHLKGQVPDIVPRTVRNRVFRELSGDTPIKFLTFRTAVYSPVEKSYRYFLPEIKKISLTCNGNRIKIGADGFRKQILLRRGFNEIEIRYHQVKANPQLFKFFIRFSHRKGVASRPLPFYHYVLPGSSQSKTVSRAILILDQLKPVGFLLALILILLSLIIGFIKKRKPEIPSEKKPDPGVPVFEFFCLFLGLIFSITFIKNRLNIYLANGWIWSAALLVALLFLMKSFKGGHITFKPDKEKILVICLISVVVFGYLYGISGKWLPMKPVGAGDLRNHMVMVRHYQQFNEIKTDEFRMVYPQSLHAFIAVISRWLGIQPEAIITLFLALFFIMTYFLIYLLVKHFFPDLSPIFFLASLLLMNFTFVLGSGFKFYYFPPLISVFFFLSALFLYYRNRLPVSSLLLAVSIIVYPYFVAIFTLPMFCLILAGYSNEEIRTGGKIRRLFLYFLLPAFFVFIYIFIYASYGFPQHQQGFVTFSKLDPFSALKPYNTFLIFLGLSTLIFRPMKKTGLNILMFSTIAAFLVYYIPYYMFNLGSSYYLIKNIFFLTMIGIIPESLALRKLAVGLKKKFRLKTDRSRHSA
jgi:hypothetical protein